MNEVIITGNATFSARQEIINTIFNTDDKVFVIDPEHEYSSLMEDLLGSENFTNLCDANLEKETY